MVIKEGEGLTRLDGLDPEAHLTEFDRHGIQVHTVDAVADHISESVLILLRTWFNLSSANLRQMAGQSMCCRNQEVTASARWIAYLEFENRLLRIAGCLPLSLLRNYRFEGRVEEALNERIWRVVGPARLSLITTGHGEREGTGLDRHKRVKLEQRFIDRPQFLGPEISVIDRAKHPVLLDVG